MGREDVLLEPQFQFSSCVQVPRTSEIVRHHQPPSSTAPRIGSRRQMTSIREALLSFAKISRSLDVFGEGVTAKARILSQSIETAFVDPSLIQALISSAFFETIAMLSLLTALSNPRSKASSRMSRMFDDEKIRRLTGSRMIPP